MSSNLFRAPRPPRPSRCAVSQRRLNASAPPSPHLPISTPPYAPFHNPSASILTPVFVPTATSTKVQSRNRHDINNTRILYPSGPLYQSFKMTWRYSRCWIGQRRVPSTRSRRWPHCRISACVFCPCLALSSDSSICTLQHTYVLWSLQVVRSNDLCQCAIPRSCVNACGMTYSTPPRAKFKYVRSTHAFLFSPSAFP